MASGKQSFKPRPAGLLEAARLLHRAYELISTAESKILGYAAYSDVHGLLSRCAHTMERVSKSHEMSQLAKKR